MNNSKFLKIFSIFAFAAFMLVSCWATVESLHMSLGWPKPFFWIAAIGIFVLSSLATKLIVDCFNQRIRVDHRGRQLMGGILMLLAFWICFSLPTNTHTFFYKENAKEIILQDLSTTKAYLKQLKDNSSVGETIKAKISNHCTDVWAAFDNFASEIRNPTNKGYGPVAKEKLSNLNRVLGGEPIKIQSGTFTSLKIREAIIDSYKAQVKYRLQADSARITQEGMTSDVKNFTDAATKNLKGIEKAEKIVNLRNINNEDLQKEDVKNIQEELTNGYTTIKNYHQYVEFSKDKDGKYIDKDYYVPTEKSDKIVTKSSRVGKVVNVWQDYFKGKYKGMGFVFWILISALVDIAGFIFFDIAFKREK